jgi:hypothetical protein
MKRTLGFAASVLGSAAVWAQAPPQVLPVPIPGGDVITVAPPLFINQFTPGVPGPGVFFDGVNAEPNGITNFEGAFAMGYTVGTATDNAGKEYQVITDIRVYQGDYFGAQASFGAGGTTTFPKKVHGTFVEI